MHCVPRRSLGTSFKTLRQKLAKLLLVLISEDSCSGEIFVLPRLISMLTSAYTGMSAAKRVVATVSVSMPPCSWLSGGNGLAFIERR